MEKRKKSRVVDSTGGVRGIQQRVLQNVRVLGRLVQIRSKIKEKETFL